MGDITSLLRQSGAWDAREFNDLYRLVYDEMRRIARLRVRSERAGHTLNATALVHECFLKLRELDRIRWQDRRHFFAMATEIMKRILVDYARRRKAHKRGGDAPHLSLSDGAVDQAKLQEEAAWFFATEDDAELRLMIDEALEEYGRHKPMEKEIFELAHYGKEFGITHEDIADMYQISTKTVQRTIRKAEGWLRQWCTGERPPPPDA